MLSNIDTTYTLEAMQLSHLDNDTTDGGIPIPFGRTWRIY